MIPPPNAYMSSAGAQNVLPTTNKLAQQMQDMKLDSSAHQNSPAFMNYSPMNNQHSVTGAQSPRLISPQHKPHMPTTVTYSGPPRVTYPYPNNPPSTSNLPKPPASSNQYDFNSHVSQSNIIGHEPKVNTLNSVPLSQHSPIINRNGYTNGHEDMIKSHTDQSFQNSYQPPPSQSQISPGFQQVQYQPMSPTLISPNSQQYQQLSAHSSLSNTHSYQPVSNSQMVSGSSQVYSSLGNQSPQQLGNQSPQQLSNQSPQQLGNQSPQQSAFQNIPAQSPPPGFLPPPASQSNPPFSGMPSSPPNSGSMWPNQQYPNAQMPGNYPYSSQNQGVPPQQQQRKFGLDQMPSNVHVREEDRENRGGYYTTDVIGLPPPLVTTDFIVQDRGMCSPRFIRSSVYCLPTQSDMLKQTAVPFALTICPMASLTEGEVAPPLALYREQGPLRCKRCKAYICPFMTFTEGGRCFQCAFCKVATEVPQDYFCFLDSVGERSDKFHRPELCLGSYEYLATKEYCRNDQMPNPPAYIFMIEVSNATFRNGLVPLLCENIKSVLQCLKNDEQNDTSKLRVGFVTYNNVLHFYNMKKNLTQPHIMVLSDVHNAFVPLLDGFLVTLSEAEALVDGLMEHIPRLFINEPATEIILGPVVQVGLEALKNANCSGKLLIFHSSIPNADAPGKLPYREGQKLLGTDKQKTILSPQSDFYTKLAQECVAAGCAVDLFLFPNAYVDIASISPLCRHTGGQIYKYTYFQSHIDGDRFLEDLERNITTTTAFDAVLRVRTSAGISPVFYYGNFYMSNTTDIELSAIDCHKAITIELAYDDKLPENETIYIQAALLYTTNTGERRIRVHNLALATSVGMPDIFKCCDHDTIINFLAKQALKQILELTPQQIKSNVVNRSVKILSCYRKHCATTTSAGQLLLPDPLKLLPLFVNCLLKSDAVSGGSDISLDDRSFAMLAVNSMDVKSTATYFYPTLIPLHDVDPDSDTFPSHIRCTIEKLNDNGAYLLENGIYMFLWIGQAISPDWLQNVFGVQSTNQVDKQKTSLPDLNTPLSHKIRSLIEELEDGRQWYMRLTVMVQGDKLEAVFRQFLVEDRGTDGSASYVDFLCHLHREISKNL